MPRLTISLTDRTYRALKEEAARQGPSIDALIEQCLVLRGIVPTDTAQEIVARARSAAGMIEDEAMAIAVRETKLYRATQRD